MQNGKQNNRKSNPVTYKNYMKMIIIMSFLKAGKVDLSYEDETM